jgi:integrase
VAAGAPWRLLITNWLGRPVQRNSFGFCWREAVKAADLPKGTRFHDLRHFYGSTLIAAGLHPKVIQERLGHATIAETMDTYGKARVLHEAGEKPQVSRSPRCRNSVPRLPTAAV